MLGLKQISRSASCRDSEVVSELLSQHGWAAAGHTHMRVESPLEQTSVPVKESTTSILSILTMRLFERLEAGLRCRKKYMGLDVHR
jgi:hypothetical protein